MASPSFYIIDRGELMSGFIESIKQFIFRITWRREVCPKCMNVKRVSNFKPCGQCVLGSKFERIPDEKE